MRWGDEKGSQTMISFSSCLAMQPALYRAARSRRYSPLRPGALASVRASRGGLGYAGFMMDDGRLTRFAALDPRPDQSGPPKRIRDLDVGRHDRRYIDNFFF